MALAAYILMIYRGSLVSKDKLLYVDFYPGDWIGGTQALTSEMRGVYITLMAHFWNNQKPLDDDDQRNARLCNLSTHRFRKIKNILLYEGKIEIKGGCIWNDRAAKTLDNSLTKSAKNSAKARTASDARWEKYLKKAGKKPEKDQPFPDLLSGKNGENMKVLTQETAENSQSADATSNAPSNASQSQSQSQCISTSLESCNNSDRKEKLRECEIAASFQFKKRDEDQFDKWLSDGMDLQKDIIPTIKRLLARQRKIGDPPKNLPYYDSAIRSAKAKRLVNGPAVSPVDPKKLTTKQWEKRLHFDLKKEKFESEFYNNQARNNFPHCNPPTMPGCFAPPKLQKALLKAWNIEKSKEKINVIQSKK